MNPENLPAMGLMVLGMAFFASEDFFIKRVSAEMPVLQLLTVLCAAGALIFALLCLWRRAALFSRDVLDRGVVIRNVSETVATLCFVTALSRIPLSLAAAILQATPLFVTAGAALWLGETVGWRRWSAVVVGLFGVLLILRPGLDGFRADALLAVVAALGLATRDVVSRRIPRRIETVQLSFWAFGCLALVTGLFWALEGTSVPVSPPAWRDLGLATIFGVSGYMALTAATRLGDVATVIPFRYTRLLFALFLGTVFLGERPDALTLIGAAIVVGAGLYALMRERRLKHG